VLEKPGSLWKVAGKLRRLLGYGVSVTHGGGVVCFAGSDADGHRAECFRLEWRGGKLETKPLSTLLRAVAKMSGGLLGDTLYVAGGIEKPDSTSTLKTFYALDLGAKQPTRRELLIDGMRAMGRSEQSSREASPHEKNFEFFVVSQRGIGPTVASFHCSRSSP
jgi:hypothetical protein